LYAEVYALYTDRDELGRFSCEAAHSTKRKKIY
jgi:hypothetical protein